MKGRKSVGIVPMPESLPPYLMMPEGLRFVRTETILLNRLPSLFRSFRVVESCVLCVTRNADISFDEEKFEDNEEDFRRQFRKLLRKRSHLAVMRLELGQPISDAFQEMLSGLIRVETHQDICRQVPPEYALCLPPDLPAAKKYGRGAAVSASYRPLAGGSAAGGGHDPPDSPAGPAALLPL